MLRAFVAEVDRSASPRAAEPQAAAGDGRLEEALRLQADLLLRASDYEAAAAVYTRLLLEWPDSPSREEYLFRRANAFLSAGDEPRALKDFQSLAGGADGPAANGPAGGAARGGRASPYLAESLYALGYAYASGREYARALPYFERALAAGGPRELAGRALLARGVCLYNLERYDEALETFRRLAVESGKPAAGEAGGTAAEPWIGEGLFHLGRTLYRMDRMEEAVEGFRQAAAALGGRSGGAEALFWQGTAELRLGRLEPARDSFLRLAREHPLEPRLAESPVPGRALRIQAGPARGGGGPAGAGPRTGGLGPRPAGPGALREGLGPVPARPPARGRRRLRGAAQGGGRPAAGGGGVLPHGGGRLPARRAGRRPWPGSSWRRGPAPVPAARRRSTPSTGAVWPPSAARAGRGGAAGVLGLPEGPAGRPVPRPGPGPPARGAGREGRRGRGCRPEVLPPDGSRRGRAPPAAQPGAPGIRARPVRAGVGGGRGRCWSGSAPRGRPSRCAARRTCSPGGSTSAGGELERARQVFIGAGRRPQGPHRRLRPARGGPGPGGAREEGGGGGRVPEGRLPLPGLRRPGGGVAVPRGPGVRGARPHRGGAAARPPAAGRAPRKPLAEGADRRRGRRRTGELHLPAAARRPAARPSLRSRIPLHFFRRVADGESNQEPEVAV